MAINPDIRLKVRHFFQKYGKIIIIIAMVLIIIIFINKLLLGTFGNSEGPTTTFAPHTSVMDSSSEVPEKVANEFESFIEKYVGYCNDRDYVSAYNLVSEDCKKNFFDNDYNSFVDYVQVKFDGKKKYAIQSYSNYNDKYIYNVRIFDDFLATGLTNQSYRFNEEKMTISYDENNNLVVAVGNYIESQDLQYQASNDYMKAEITGSMQKYSYIVYDLKLTNRSNYTIVIQDGNAESEIYLEVGDEARVFNENINIVLSPGKTRTVKVNFPKFYDSDLEVGGLVLNAVRVMENYTGNAETAEQEIENAVDKFSMTISLK